MRDLRNVMVCGCLYSPFNRTALRGTTNVLMRSVSPLLPALTLGEGFLSLSPETAVTLEWLCT